eukprot:1016834-Prymnesium_polylepis.1
MPVGKPYSIPSSSSAVRGGAARARPTARSAPATATGAGGVPWAIKPYIRTSRFPFRHSSFHATGRAFALRHPALHPVHVHVRVPDFGLAFRARPVCARYDAELRGRLAISRPPGFSPAPCGGHGPREAGSASGTGSPAWWAYSCSPASHAYRSSRCPAYS